MPARRCRTCGNNYPTGQENLRCRTCDEETIYIANIEPDSENIPPAELQEGEFPALQVTPEIRNGALVIDSRELIRSGRHQLTVGGIYSVFVDGFGEFFIEVLDYSSALRLYIVREFKFTAPDFVPEEWVNARAEG